MSDENKVRFIRKNGRIIPIRQKNDRKEGMGMLATAVGVAGLGGYAAGQKLRRAERASQMTFDFMEDLPGSKLPKGASDVFEGFTKARSKLNMAKKFAKASRWISTGLIFAGLHKILKDETDPAATEVAKVAGAAAASDFVARGIYAGFKKKSPFAMPLSSDAKKAGLEAFKKFAKRKIL